MRLSRPSTNPASEAAEGHAVSTDQAWRRHVCGTCPARDDPPQVPLGATGPVGRAAVVRARHSDDAGADHLPLVQVVMDRRAHRGDRTVVRARPTHGHPLNGTPHGGARPGRRGGRSRRGGCLGSRSDQGGERSRRDGSCHQSCHTCPTPRLSRQGTDDHPQGVQQHVIGDRRKGRRPAARTRVARAPANRNTENEESPSVHGVQRRLPRTARPTGRHARPGTSAELHNWCRQ